MHLHRVPVVAVVAPERVAALVDVALEAQGAFGQRIDPDTVLVVDIEEPSVRRHYLAAPKHFVDRTTVERIGTRLDDCRRHFRYWERVWRGNPDLVVQFLADIVTLRRHRRGSGGEQDSQYGSHQHHNKVFNDLKVPNDFKDFIPFSTKSSKNRCRGRPHSVGATRADRRSAAAKASGRLRATLSPPTA